MIFPSRRLPTQTPQQWAARGRAIQSSLEGLSLEELLRGRMAHGRSGYDPSQPRVPVGHPDGGQWTSESRSVGAADIRDVFDEVPDAVDGFLRDFAQPQIQLAAGRVTIDYADALIRDPTIDRATQFLSETVATTVELTDRLPLWTPARYGIAVHAAFGALVRAAGYEGIGTKDVEHSFSFGIPGRYGGFGTVRTDVVLRNIHGEVIAIYDMKTGGAKLDDARVRELRRKSGVGANVPIFELHILRGASRRGSHDIFSAVIVQRWTQ